MSRRNPEINIGIIGAGTVGSSVIDLFKQGRGEPYGINLKRVAVRDLSKPRNHQFPLTDNVADMLCDPNLHIIVELKGGVDEARGYMFGAIDRGKSVVTANKAVMSRNAKPLFDAARSQSVDLKYGAAVGGGIRILETLDTFKGERITRVMAIINGTTNYILTEMAKGADFGPVLKTAQDEGYAEADHILDTGGYDARDKLAVLTSTITNAPINVEGIPCRGILDLTSVDFGFAEEYGYKVKLLAMADMQGGSIDLRVTPALIRKDHLLAGVDGTFNAIYFEAELAGPQLLSGRGAGGNPTASDVFSDIVRAARNKQLGIVDELPTLDSQIKYANPDEVEQKGYIRVDLIDKPGSIHAVTGILYEHGLNLQNSFQREKFGYRINGDIVIPDINTLSPAPTGTINSALEKIAASPRVHGQPFFLPIID